MKLIANNEKSSDSKAARGAPRPKKLVPRTEAPVKAKKSDLSRKSDASKKAVKKSGEAGKGVIDVFRDYLRDVIAELKKVVWPSRKETLGSTAVILIIVAISGLFLGFVDLVLSKLLHLMVH